MYLYLPNFPQGIEFGLHRIALARYLPGLYIITDLPLHLPLARAAGSSILIAALAPVRVSCFLFLRFAVPCHRGRGHAHGYGRGRHACSTNPPLTLGAQPRRVGGYDTKLYGYMQYAEWWLGKVGLKV